MAQLITNGVAIVGREHRTALVTSDETAERFQRLLQSVNGDNIKVDVLGAVEDFSAVEAAARAAGYSQLLIAVQL